MARGGRVPMAPRLRRSGVPRSQGYIVGHTMQPSCFDGARTREQRRREPERRFSVGLAELHQVMLNNRRIISWPSPQVLDVAGHSKLGTMVTRLHDTNRLVKTLLDVPRLQRKRPR